jgi:uncharacterized protein (DUF1810 family)
MDEALKNELQRFILAQEESASFEVAKIELVAGHKETHWMWWVFPQLRALGKSERAVYYGIQDLAEAKAYLDNETLARHLLEVTDIVLQLSGNNPVAVFGDVDAQKLQASWTLFEAAAEKHPTFALGLEKYFGGERHAATLAELNK